MQTYSPFRITSTTTTQLASLTTTPALPVGSNAVRLYVKGTGDVLVGFGDVAGNVVADYPVAPGTEIVRHRLAKFMKVVTPASTTVAITTGEI